MESIERILKAYEKHTENLPEVPWKWGVNKGHSQPGLFTSGCSQVLRGFPRIDSYTATLLTRGCMSRLRGEASRNVCNAKDCEMLYDKYTSKD